MYDNIQNAHRMETVSDTTIIQQETKFQYLDIEFSGYGDVESKVRNLTTKVSRLATCLNNTIWYNNHIGSKSNQECT